MLEIKHYFFACFSECFVIGKVGYVGHPTGIEGRDSLFQNMKIELN